MSLLSVRQVTLRFGGITAVANVSLDVAENSLLGFIGPNGAGKTTLMRIITGVLHPQQGQVLLQGRDITHWPVNRRINAGLALSQQIVRPLRSLSVLDNVTLAVGSQRMANPLSALLHTRRVAERTQARELLASVGLADAAQAMPSTLPLGHLKRLEVARALALQPSLLLLDEPLAGLTPSEAQAMADLIASLVGADGGRSVILIEHNIREVARICPQLYVQDNGRRLLHGPTAQVMAAPELQRAYLGNAQGVT